ncbi:MAG: amino acid carrier protein [Clostridia bacterium]
MQAVFESLNDIFKFIGPVSDWLWEFPTNYAWYSSIPVLGSFPLAIILLLGCGLFFTIKTGFVQLTHFGAGMRSMITKQKAKTGLSSLGGFFMSTAMRVGPGNIIGVTGAITTGGPGALFWMWVSAFLGMATAYVESVLAQIFKEKKEGEYVGGLPFYGKRLLGNRAAVGVFLSLLYILYALCCLPAQSFNTISALSSMVTIVTGVAYDVNSTLYYALGIVIVIITAVIAFGGVRAASKVNNKLVPVMAAVYCVAVLALVLMNLRRVPAFFVDVLGGAFKAEAIFGGVFGTVIAQGVKRGLMSNEAGQGTITMAAATAEVDHPAKQGFVESIGVFLDTIVICTLTGFVVVMAQLWQGPNSAAFMSMDRLPKFIASVAELTPGAAVNVVSTMLVTVCFALFAYTCVTSFLSFSEIAANRISKNPMFINIVRAMCIVCTVFGLLCNMAGLNLDNLWLFSDLGNILIVLFNIPLLLIGAKYVFRATRHYKKHDGTRFDSSVIGCKAPYWDERTIDEDV